jgi:ferrochelatase
MNNQRYDAILLVSFGGPEGMDDVMPFLENVLRGKNVPRDRMLEVFEHYRQFGGVSPINEQNHSLIAALELELKDHQINLPIYFGNRNWHPLLADTLRRMKDEGIKHSLAFFTSMYSCYSGCRQYRENIADAQATIGAEAPEVHKLRMAFNHPLYIEASADCLRDVLISLPSLNPTSTRVLFTAHSIPLSMAENCKYESQLLESGRLIMESFTELKWDLVYQSRSGPPTQPWLEPDVCDFIQELHKRHDVQQIVIMPIGFVSDHVEVLFDLDEQAREICNSLGIGLARAKTVGVHPKFVAMIRELIEERISGAEKRAIGNFPPNWDACPADCCTYPNAGRP